jgi:GNAT superfamily N-acetyltransferase
MPRITGDLAEPQEIMKLALEEGNGNAIAELQNGLHGFNMARAPEAAWKELILTLRDDSGVLHGGVVAHMFADSCYVDTVWTDEATRGQGWGRKMLEMVEDEARGFGARGAWLYTTSFQAKPFYEKLGYSQFAELQWPGSAIARHFMRKEF